MPVKADSVSIVTKPEIVSFNPFPHEIHTDLLSYLLDAGDGWVTYFWSTGESSRTINVVENGKYSIEVTNTLGCIGKKTVVVNLGPRPDTLYSISNGSWNDPATWHQGFIPIFNSNVVVSHKIIITDDRICRSLLLKNGSDLTIENNKRLSVEYLD
jgi:hypothetical protein